MSWSAEFGREYDVPAVILNDTELSDVSWHNDMCPSFEVTSDGRFHKILDYVPRLWVEHPEREQREHLSDERYCVGGWDGSSDLDTNDVERAIARLKALSKQGPPVEAGKKSPQKRREEVDLTQEEPLEQQVYNIIRKHHVNASFEWPGFILVPARENGFEWAIGTANAFWSADYNTKDGDNVFGVNFDWLSKSDNVEAIAADILGALDEPIYVHRLRDVASRLLTVLAESGLDLEEHAALINEARGLLKVREA